MALSDNLKARRIERGLSMDDVAEKIGVTKTAISSFEANRAKPQPEVLVALAQCLGTTCEELVIGKEA